MYSPENAAVANGTGFPAGSSTLPAMEDTNAAMEAANIFGIIHVTTLSIIIDGNVYKHFESFQLSQSTSAHHSFRLVLQYDILGETQDHSMEDARRFLGSRISVTFTYKNVLSNSPEREFIGVITQAGFSQTHGGKGSIVLTGHSPTVLLAAAAHTQSFGGAQPVSLSSIAKEVISQGLGESRFDVSVSPAYKGNLLYSSQYNESHHNYLARMAAAYGEWYFYDGRVLHFGKPATANPIRLIYGRDTQEVQLQMSAVHVSRQHYGYNSSSHTQLSAGATEVAGLGELGGFAIDASRKAFITPSNTVSPVRAVSDKDVEATQKSAAGTAAAGAFILTGKTSVPFLYPGCLIEMNFRKPESSDVKYFSRLIITEVSHSLDARGNYEGHFEAMPADTEYLPAPVYVMPSAQPQIATVMSNASSEGRVKVQFDWQRGQDTTDFIRVATPDGGGTGNVSQNRGFVFIPEEGDQVMVNFQHGNPDRPFVQSAMFHGGNGVGGYQENHKKSIITRSGCHIVIDDTEGQGSIHLQDPSGNTWHMDGAGNITVTAPKDVNINAGKDFNIKVGENMNINVGKNRTSQIGNNEEVSISNNKTEAIEKDYLQLSDNKNVTVKKNKSEKVGNAYKQVAGESDIQTSKGDLKLRGTSLAVLQGGKDVKVSKG